MLPLPLFLSTCRQWVSSASEWALYEIIGIWMQSVTNQSVRDVRTIESLVSMWFTRTQPLHATRLTQPRDP
jgi:hypothetical protein